MKCLLLVLALLAHQASAGRPNSSDITSASVCGGLLIGAVVYFTILFVLDYRAKLADAGPRGKKEEKAEAIPGRFSDSPLGPVITSIHELYRDALHINDIHHRALVDNIFAEANKLRPVLHTKNLMLTLGFEERLTQVIADISESSDAVANNTEIEKLKALVDRGCAVRDTLNTLLAPMQANLVPSVALDKAKKALVEIEAIAAELGPACVERLTWALQDERVYRFASQIRQHIRFYQHPVLQRSLIGRDPHSWRKNSAGDQPILMGLTASKEPSRRPSFFAHIWYQLPSRFRNNPFFVLLIISGYIGIAVSHWVFIDSGRMRTTFLNVPRQYSINTELQSITVPIIYGIMHTVLYSLGWMPVAFLRGTWRDVTRILPSIRRVIPVDDLLFWHRVFAVMALLGFVAAGTVWLVSMSVFCFDTHVLSATAQQRSCNAFSPIIVDATVRNNPQLLFDSIKGASWFDPRDNVLFLRLLAWILWCFFMPLMQFAVRKPPFFLPARLRRNWFELVFYIHYIVAWLTVIIALYARFEVFYPILISWGWYALDRMRDFVFYTHRTQIIIDITNPMTSRVQESAKDGEPTLLNVRLTKPRRFTRSAGQWLYIKVPSIDPFWHPFSVASASAESTVNLHIGIRGTWSDERRENGEWVQPKQTRTWTYNLLEKFRKHGEMSYQQNASSNIKAWIRGPYGSPFTKCFQSKYKAAVVIGAGTGLTAALSILKEMVQRRIDGTEKHNKLVWFVWSCRRVDDLLWCWRTLEETLYEAYRHGVIDIDSDTWSPWTSASLEWLNVCIYVSRADHKILRDFLTMPLMGEMDHVASLHPEEKGDAKTNGSHGGRSDAAHKKPASPRKGQIEQKAADGNDGVLPLSTVVVDAGSEKHGWTPVQATAIVAAEGGSPVPATVFAESHSGAMAASVAGLKQLPMPLAETSIDSYAGTANVETLQQEPAEAGLDPKIIPTAGSEHLAGRTSPPPPYTTPRRTSVLSVIDMDQAAVGVTPTAAAAVPEQNNRGPAPSAARMDAATVSFRRPRRTAPPAPMAPAIARNERMSRLYSLAQGDIDMPFAEADSTAATVIRTPADFGRESPDLGGGGSGSETPLARTWFAGVCHHSELEALLKLDGRIGFFQVRFSVSNNGLELGVVIGDGGRVTFFVLDTDSAGAYTLNGAPIEGAPQTMELAVAALLASGHPAFGGVRLLAPSELKKDEKKGYGEDEEEDDVVVDGVPKDIVKSIRVATKRLRQGRGDTKRMLHLARLRKLAGQEHDIHSWLQQQVIEAPLTHKTAHISRLLAWVKDTVIESTQDPKAKIAVCFCGPNALAHVIADSSREVGASLEYSAEHQ